MLFHFQVQKNTLLGEGLDKNGEPVMLKYRGGFYFPFDKLQGDLCFFGASFSTEKANLKPLKISNVSQTILYEKITKA